MAKKKTYLKTINLKTLGRAGGLARAAKLTPAKRKAAAKKAARARWDKAKGGAV